jgi:chromosome segregation ATPase
MAPSDDRDEPVGGDGTVSPIEELRERLRPRALDAAAATPGERLALERVQALEVQITSAHLRERELIELSVRDGNKITGLRAEVEALRPAAARAEDAERAVFESETRAAGAVRRAELMDGELMSTRAEIDRLRTRIVELEASLRRALEEVGQATVRAEVATIEQERRDRERPIELAEGSHGETDPDPAPTEARLADLEQRLGGLDARIAALTGSYTVTDIDIRDEADANGNGDVVVDIRDADEAQVVHDVGSEPIKPPASRWSDWRTT